MKKIWTLFGACALTLLTWGGYAQQLVDFEGLGIGVDSFLNGSDGSSGFQMGDLRLDNSYNPAWASWSGWAISSMRDTVTAGYTNQYSAITGGGREGSAAYAVAYAASGSMMRLSGASAGKVVAGLYVTNATYTYLSMRDGDGFAKKFGGITGNDPDFLRLTIKKYFNGVEGSDSVVVYLADFRSADNTQDYILKDWTYVDLTPLGNVDSLVFLLESSDVGAFGMNTPAYFCVDDVELAGYPASSSAAALAAAWTAFPNPVTTSDLQVQGLPVGEDVPVRLWDAQGRLLWERQSQGRGRMMIPMLHSPKGHYVLQVGSASRVIVK